MTGKIGNSGRQAFQEPRTPSSASAESHASTSSKLEKKSSSSSATDKDDFTRRSQSGPGRPSEPGRSEVLAPRSGRSQARRDELDPKGKTSVSVPAMPWVLDEPVFEKGDFTITHWPEDLKAARLVLKLMIGGKEYRLRTRGPSTAEKLYTIALNTAKAAFVMQESGVRKYKRIELHKNGKVRVGTPLLGDAGPIKEHYEEALRADKLEGDLTSVSLRRKGTLVLRTDLQSLEVGPKNSKLRNLRFVSKTGETSTANELISQVVRAVALNATQGDTKHGGEVATDSTVASEPVQTSGRSSSGGGEAQVEGDSNSELISQLVPLGAEEREGSSAARTESLVANPLFGADKPGLLRADGSLGDRRTITDAFDFAERTKKQVDKPGYLEAVFRGKKYQPVFKKGDNFFKRHSADLGNWLMKVCGQVGTNLVHEKFDAEHIIPLTDDLTLGFTASGRKIKESSLKSGDPRLVGIEELRTKHPRAIPAWVEGKLGQNLSFKFGHDIPLGPSGVALKFGFKADEKLDFTMNRLVHFKRGVGATLADSGEQLKRLKLTPLKGESLAEMETGASFSLKGSANLRLDAGIGLGASVPAVNNLVNVGANVEVGAFASLSGKFGLDVKRMPKGVARVTVSSQGDAGAGVKLSAFAGVKVEKAELSKILREFVGHVAEGGDPNDFGESLGSDKERALASSMFGYTNLLLPFAKNLADGTGTAVVDHMVKNYASAAFEARKGIELKKQFSTNLDFNLTSTYMVTLPRADMLPEEMRNGVAEDHPIKVSAGDVATLAYNMAVRGDLRLAQQASLIRNSGVRINEEVTTDTKKTTGHLEVKLPFMEFRRTDVTSTKTIDHYTPEMGRTKSLIESFNQDYANFFGDTEDYGAEIRVHTPEGMRNEKLFVGSDDNFSADFVVENLTEKWTNFEEMQDYIGVLNALSEGRLATRCHEALAEGEYRDRDDLSFAEKLYMHREYGRTTARLHVWLGEQGLRSLLNVDCTEDEYYERVGEVFTNLDSTGGAVKPWWAVPGADRSIKDSRGRLLELTGGGAAAYDVKEHSRDLKAARYLVDNLMRLQTHMRDADTPAKEHEVATEIRDFLQDAKSKYSSYAALAMLVPEQQRAVEIRLSSIRPKKAPIRISYIQDGRGADLLHATGYSKMALKQLTRYGTVLDPENKARIGNLLKRLNGVLNSPSPDLFVLKRTLSHLRDEMALLDEEAPKMEALIDGDVGMARAFMDTLPDAETIQAVLPGMLGTNLATMRINAERELNKGSPDFTLVRSQMKNILKKMPYYRHIQGARDILDNTAHLSQALATARPDLVQAAIESVNEFRATLERAKLDPNEITAALEHVTSVNALLTSAMGETLSDLGELATTGNVEEIEESVRAKVGTGESSPNEIELKKAREAEANKYRDLVGDPKVAAVSYFERTRAIPKGYMGTALKKLGNGAVTASMIRDAELAMATSRPTGVLAAPALSKANVDKLLALASEDRALEFMTSVDELRFRPEPNYDDPSRVLIESLLASIPVGERETILEGLSKAKQAQFKKVFVDFDSAQAAGRSVSPREAILENHPAHKADLGFLRELLAQGDSKSLEAAINSLGYSGTLKKWHASATTRLEAVFSKMDGDQLNKLVGELGKTERKRFLELVKTSDLRPQTRARLAGAVVDNKFFWRKEEELVAALVTNLNAGDLRLFFDQLYADGKLENFLKAGSWWQTFLQVFTFGLARLFTHNNEAAVRVVAAKGWKSAELQAQYASHIPLSQRIERQAESIFLEATLDTLPMDPVVKTGLRAVNSVCGNVKYYHLDQLPKAGAKVLEKVIEGAGEQLVYRLVDVASQGGSSSEIAAEYQKFFEALTPQNIAKEFREGDEDGTAVVLAMALKAGALEKLKKEAKSRKNKFITPELITFLDAASTTGLEGEE